MIIKSAHLHNVMSFKEIKLSFSRNINIIIGDNNSGKSTIIRSIDRLQGGNINAEGWVRNGVSHGYSIFSFEGAKATKYFSEVNKVFMLIQEGNITLAQILNASNKEPRLRNLSKLKFNEDGEFPEENLKRFVSFSDEEPDNVLYASYARRGYYESQISKENTNRIRQDLGNLNSRLQKLDNGNHYNHKPFKKACKEILGFEPGVIAYGRGGNNQLSIGIYTDNTNIITINNMGQGVTHILGLLTILYTQDDNIILLEEIENDLHPRVLKQLLNVIVEKSRRNQFIISTHSNIVLRHLGAVSGSRIFQTSWKMSKYGKQRLPLSQIQEIANTPEARVKVLQEMGYDVLDFELWQGYLLFEESTSELIVREYLIPTFTPKLKDKLRTVASQGVDDISNKFKSFLNLFVFIHLSNIYHDKAWVIVDGDSAGIKVINDLKKTFNNWNPDNFIHLELTAFELYYPSRFSRKVDKVLGMSKGMEKQKAKVQLRQEVLEWARHNENAQGEFQKSAGELIQILKQIESSFH